MDVRKLATSMVVVGAAALAGGMMADAMRHADDAGLSATEGILALDSLAHAVFFGGAVIALFGVLLLLAGERLYVAPGGVTGGRRLAQIGAPLAAIALVAGCAAAASNTSLAEGTGASGDQAATHTHGDMETADPAAHDDHATTGDHADHAAGDTGSGTVVTDHGEVITATATGDSPCEQTGDPASPGQTGDGHGETRGMLKQQPLTEQERLQLQEQMAQARTVVDRYPTVASALAAGYQMSTPYVPCIGAHYTNTGLVAKFDPTAPSELLYDGTADDARIVGLSYLVFHPGGAPEGFAGENDVWHQHNANGGLCLQGGVVVAGEDSTPEECEAAGGRKTVLQDIWMMHAWVVPGFECSWGVFAGECPELGGRLGGTAWD